MGKLVRDRIPEIIRLSGRKPASRILATDEYQCALIEKLFEEAQELRDADAAQQLEEAADVYEVLLAIVANSGFTVEELHSAAERKRLERGGFHDRVWLD
ncbi:phosphoribosyl-ATP pyrophosphohydrolase [Rhodococcus sp. ACS1]|uniref:nucleoside triphosphate pyrophosphohydrolase n=1 Tax=Rhodococcus sp. ACS1 TaxID=2028570 RepID=UPI000BB13DA0|nr:nucleoside triphosphate pyrophosphohydrolase [Rhodococcus sp. ACS1]PBC36294.1 phosphoribosyl-ATP pyrophosphohydrolase [Rhodococcus sp. ACS1]